MFSAKPVPDRSMTELECGPRGGDSKYKHEFKLDHWLVFPLFFDCKTSPNRRKNDATDEDVFNTCPGIERVGARYV